MQYRHSHLIDPSSYPTQGLCTGIPLRCHRNSDIDEHGTIRLRSDWQTHVGPLPQTTHGGLGPHYNFTAVTIPECRPDRLEIVAYAMEFAFLHDDLIDADETGNGVALYEGIMRDIGVRSRGGNPGGSVTGEGRLLRGIIEEMARIDAGRTREVLGYWKRGVSLPRDRTRFGSFEEYLDFRLVDSGAFLLTGLMTFGMALTIPPEEKDECVNLTRCVWLAAFLTNDVQSWEKEREEYKTLIAASDGEDTPHMVNGVWVLMQQDGVDVEEAIKRVLQKVKGFVADVVRTVEDVRSREDLSEDSRCFVEAAQYMVSGNLVWGIDSPRYHADRTLNALQVARMESTVCTWPHHVAPVIKDPNLLPTPLEDGARVGGGEYVESV
ncbi:terpenoid synthase [Karstenula rhodostoma CBS 690.94]|uniref:Terpenoid synthase n=1 Tax=Karstenula rhodostoma CBS 690.94 TaxID=1392251 RepID=A0A9P4UJ56_9PLEO|nr:terpenoid synthase [Karstenula rhodostoma CBS 690.94]